MAAASSDNRSHSSAMRIDDFCSSCDDVITAPCCRFVRRVVGLAVSPSDSTIPVPPPRVPAVAEQSVYLMNRAFRVLRYSKLGVISPWGWDCGGGRCCYQ